MSKQGGPAGSCQIDVKYSRYCKSYISKRSHTLSLSLITDTVSLFRVPFFHSADRAQLALVDARVPSINTFYRVTVCRVENSSLDVKVTAALGACGRVVRSVQAAPGTGLSLDSALWSRTGVSDGAR